MEIIKPSVSILEERDPLKKIEIASRTCYKSEDKITDDSAVRMFKTLSESRHTAMLEHATFVFQVEGNFVADDANESAKALFAAECAKEKYLNVTYECGRLLVSGNLRAINNSHKYALLAPLNRCNPLLAYESPSYHQYPHVTATIVDFESLSDKTENEIRAHRYTTMRFITNRGVSHELVRHRPFSFAQESTRYVLYSSTRHGGGNIKFIEPADWSMWSDDIHAMYIEAWTNAERSYNMLTAAGATAQEARAVLPIDLKTEIVVTGNDAEWQHFFNLRSKGTTGKPHPDMKRVADMALKLYEEKYSA